MAIMSVDANLVQALQASLDPDSQFTAEAELKLFSQQPGYALPLLTIFQSPDVDNGARQLAGVILKSYIRKNWEKAGVISEHEKAYIRSTLLQCFPIVVPCKPLLTTCCALVTTIAEIDFPTSHWPELMPFLICALNSHLANAAMHCISLLVSDLPLDSLVEICSHLYPELTRVLIDSSNNSYLRYKSLSIINSLMETIPADDDDQVALDSLVNSHIFQWCRIVKDICLDPRPCPNIGYSVCVEACNLLSGLVRYFGIHLSSGGTITPAEFNELVSTILRSTIMLLPQFQSLVVNAAQQSCYEMSSQDPPKHDLSSYFTAVLDFFSAATWPSVDALERAIFSYIDDLVRLALFSVQVPVHSDPLWEEDLEDGEYTPRLAGKDLLSRLESAFYNCTNSLHVQCKVYLNDDSWTMRESALMLYGLLRSPPSELFEIVVRSLSDPKPHVQTRAIWCIGEFVDADILNGAGWSDVSPLVVTCLSNDSQAVRLTAATVITKARRRDLTFATPLISLAIQYMCRSLLACFEQCHILKFLESIRSILLDEAVLTEQDLVTNVVVQVWASNRDDVTIVSGVIQTLGVFSTSSSLTKLQTATFPIIADIFNSPSLPSSIHEGAFDLLNKLLATFADMPLNSEICQFAVSTILPCLTQSKDVAILYSCIECLSSLLRSGSEHVGAYLPSIIQAAGELLNASNYSVRAGYVVYMILSFFHSSLPPTAVSFLIECLVARLSKPRLPLAMTVDAILPLSKMVHVFQGPAIIEMLVALDPSRDILTPLFCRWTGIYEDIQSPFTRTISLTAIAQLVLLSDERIHNIKVPGDIIIDTEAPRRTRSQGPAASLKHSEIPLPSKVVSLLISELPSAGLSADESSSSTEAASGENDRFSDGSSFDDIEENSEPSEEFSHDPLFHVDLRDFSVQFLAALRDNKISLPISFISVRDQMILKNSLGFEF